MKKILNFFKKEKKVRICSDRPLSMVVQTPFQIHYYKSNVSVLKHEFRVFQEGQKCEHLNTPRNQTQKKQTAYRKRKEGKTFAGVMINPQWHELPMSRTDFHCPKDVRVIEVRLYQRSGKILIRLLVSV